MQLSVELPDLIARSLRLDGPRSNQRALEMLALEGYREGELSRGQVSEMLGMEFNETEAFLKCHSAMPGFTVADYDRSGEALEKLLSR
jgi:predicted HTH domain antitoxin